MERSSDSPRFAKIQTPESESEYDRSCRIAEQAQMSFIPSRATVTLGVGESLTGVKSQNSFMIATDVNGPLEHEIITV
jgi:hypothetical protein